MADVYRRSPPLLAQLVPESAPFDEEQRAWLNGFLAGLLGLANDEAVPESRASAIARDPECSTAHRDPALPLEQRLKLASDQPIEQRVCAALAQLDCGQCGSSCEAYARALASGADRDLTRCVPGGRATAHALESLLLEQFRAPTTLRAWALGGAARRTLRSRTEPTRNARWAEHGAADGDGGADGDSRAHGDSRAKLDHDAKGGRAAQGSRAETRGASSELLRLRIRAHRKLTVAEAGSEVREIVLESTDGALEYRAGDNLAIFPHNDPDLVRGLLRALGARGQELVPTASGPREIWRCLLEERDITRLRRETLELFAHEAAAAGDAAALRELAERGATGMDLLDLLGTFPSARPSVERILSTLGRLEPRLYAIASSPCSHPTEMHLAVRMVRAERAGRERKGVASQFLGDGLLRCDDILARVHAAEPFALGQGAAGPLILVAGGTGIARYRAYLEELASCGHRGDTWLILSSCHDGDEALYEAELRQWLHDGVLEHVDVLKPAQRGRRVALADVLRKRARRLLTWLERGGLLYACGERAALAPGLNETLLEVLCRHGKRSAAEAAEFVNSLRHEGRFLEELY